MDSLSSQQWLNTCTRGIDSFHCQRRSPLNVLAFHLVPDSLLWVE